MRSVKYWRLFFPLLGCYFPLFWIINDLPCTQESSNDRIIGHSYIATSVGHLTLGSHIFPPQLHVKPLGPSIKPLL